MRFHSLFIFLLLLTVASCNKGGKKYVLNGRLNQYVSQEIADILEQPQAKANSPLSEMDSSWVAVLQSFYGQRDYEPAWIRKRRLTKQGDELMELLHNSRSYGIDTGWYSIATLETYFKKNDRIMADTLLAQADVLLSYSYLLMANHLHKGIIDKEGKPINSNQLGEIDMAKHLHTAIDKGRVRESLLQLQPKNIGYRHLQKALEEFLKEHALSVDTLNIPNADSFPAKAQAKAVEQLIRRKYLSPKKTNDNKAYIAALKKFQELNGIEPTGKLDSTTRESLSTSNYDLFLQAALNLQRWRWEQTFDTEYVYINIPSFTLQVLNNEKLVREHNVVVGKASSPTPELSSSITYFIVNPFWSVPRSIATEELLPKIKANTGYLASKHYRLLDNKGNEIDPKSVNWNNVNSRNFNYIIRRDPGTFNDLGQIKFMFPNRYSVYLHDTPSKNLFVNDVRGYSHGCVRLQNPVDFGFFLQERDGCETDCEDLQALIDEMQQKTIVLKKPLTIYIRYYTAAGDEDGHIHFYPDIYGKDKALEHLLAKQPKATGLYTGR
ncbi:MAG: L,D-transpeptidase family protein [Chitinophagales bacterium]|nr:L,D-transpeptidase family protein [Chitinophagales bacterium]